MIIAEYIWLDNNLKFRSKTRTIIDSSTIPYWNYDGSSTGQAEGNFSEIILNPVARFNCPFRRGNNILVLCDSYNPNGKPTSTNRRIHAKEIFDLSLESKPWFGLEQEYFMIDPKTKKPFGFPKEGLPKEQGDYYCGTGMNNVYGRKIADLHYQMCLEAGLKISGINAEVAPGQWEFQVGPCEGIESGDHLLMARYILERIAEESQILIEYHPKPIEGKWNGSGCHANFSTIQMREGTENKNGLDYINEAIEKLSHKHEEHMNLYGEGNDLRMTGKYETSDYNTFSSGVGNRGSSIRIPTETEKNKRGYFEDRRPSSNCDPYIVTSKIFETSIL